MIAFTGIRSPVRTFKIVKTSCVFGCASRSDGKEKGLSFHRLPTDWCSYVLQRLPSSIQDWCEGVPWKTEQTKREDKDEKKNTKSATPRNPPDRGKTSTASRCLAPVKSQEQDLDRHASLPSRSSVDRQDGADGCAVSDTGPVKTAADQVETDPGVESQGRSQAQLALQRSADFPWLGKETKTNRKRTGDWNGKDLPAMCDKNVPAKTLPPSAFRFGCARWRVERSHDVLTKAPLAIKRAAFPDHGACGRASIALRRARKVCTLCAARTLSRFLFSVELPSYRNRWW